MVTRRDALKAAAAAGLSTFAPAFAQGKRPLKVNLLGFALGIHVPTTAALLDILPGMGYAPETQRLDQIRTLTQTLIAGAAELGETDSITVMSAVEQGADLKIVGLWYMHTSLVFLVNADKVREFKDLEKPENIVAVNGKGDITHVMLLGPLIKRGVEVKKLNIVEIGGSGARMQALQSGRVAAVPIHFDQAAEMAKTQPVVAPVAFGRVESNPVCPPSRWYIVQAPVTGCAARAGEALNGSIGPGQVSVRTASAITGGGPMAPWIQAPSPIRPNTSPTAL